MQIAGADILNRIIISIKENKQIGTVKDLVYDPQKNKIEALLIDEGGVVVEPKVIAFKEIQEITPDAVLIKSIDSLKPGSKVVHPIPNTDNSDSIMLGTTIVTDDGTELGREKDIVFDSQSGNVVGFKVSKNNEDMQVQVEKIVASTNETTIIKQQQRNQSEKQNGILNKIKNIVSK